MDRHRSHFSAITMIGFVSAVFMLAVGVCATGHVKDIADTYLWGIPLAMIGMVGYLVIGVVALIAKSSRSKWGFFPILNYILVFFTGGFTVFLVKKAYDVGMDCPFCFLSWIVNGAMVVMTLWFLFKRGTNGETKQRAGS